MTTDAKKKILFLDHTPFIGGAQLSLTQHLAELDRSRFDLIVGCSEKARPILTEIYQKLGIKYYFITFGKLKKYNPVVFFNFAKSVFEVIKLIKKEKISLVVAISVRTDIVGSIAAFFCRLPSIWLIRDFTFNLFFFRSLNILPKKIVFNSQAVATYYDRNYDRNSKENIVYVGRNFYQKVALVSDELVSEQKRDWGIGKDEMVVGYIGRLVKWKGVHVLTEAMAMLIKQKKTNLKCIIVGTGQGQEGNNESALKESVEQYGLAKYIKFIGYHADLSIIMKALDILVLPSIQPEPFSSTIIDAMMAKVAVIATSTGGTPEIIKDGQTGLLVSPDNSLELARAINKIMADQTLKEEMVAKAYKNVMENFTAAHITRQLEAIYEKVLAK